MSSADIPALIEKLGSDVVIERQRARHELEKQGEGAADALIGALGSTNKDVRWEAAKALVSIASHKAAEPLTAMLDDEDSGTRWVAAEALLELGRDGVVAVLRGISVEHVSVTLRAGAHHVFHDLEAGPLKDAVRPVMVALESSSAAEQTPVAAHAALRVLNVAV